MQVFQSSDHLVVVWTRAVHLTSDDSPSLYRASGWMVVTQAATSEGEAPACVLRGATRVHGMSAAALEELEKLVSRRTLVNSWAEAMQKKQKVMQERIRQLT